MNDLAISILSWFVGMNWISNKFIIDTDMQWMGLIPFFFCLYFCLKYVGIIKDKFKEVNE